jgi:putative membrane-bound dehydrogenase-like protein
MMNSHPLRRAVGVLSLLLFVVTTGQARAERPTPRATDERLVVELFAEHPQIVTPTGIAVDHRGRVFVAESHTHFRPDDYDGPEHDRILILEDTDDDGRADRKTVYHEGFTYLMDLEFFRDGALYAATRGDIFRLTDEDGDGRPEVKNIVHLETTGTYPHNGISGLAFDLNDNLNFGLGENLGHDYTLVGTDGMRISGGGEGGSTYRIRPDGSKLVRVSTGWWNPWGMCVDYYGRVFGTDNDPGQSPPCRLIQVIDGGDYGYEYRYGRSGLHPLVTWTGDLPGTLPMISGTGEAPCGIIAYNGRMYQDDYLDDLFVASWADHRIERYPITQEPDKGLVTTHREIFVEAEGDFRPVGLTTGPDGEIYFTDWVSSSYTLHKQGRIWRIRRDDSVEKSATSKPDEDGSIKISLQVMDVRTELAQPKADPTKWLAGTPTAVRAEAVRRLDPSRHRQQIVSASRDPDPLVFHCAVEALARHAADQPDALDAIAEKAPLAVLLARKRNPTARAKFAERELGEYLNHSTTAVRLTAVKWIADDVLKQYRPQLEAMLGDETLNYRLFLAVGAALDRLDGKKPSDRPSPERLLARITDDRSSLAVRRIALRLIDPTYKPLKLALLKPLLTHHNQALRLEALRTLAGLDDENRLPVLADVARDEDQPTKMQAAAIAGLAADSNYADLLLQFAAGDDAAMRDEALRSLVGIELNDKQRKKLAAAAGEDLHTREATARLLGKPLVERPPAQDTVSWLADLPRTGDPEAGERIFFGKTIGTCAKCHAVEGRGNAVGPSLTKISQRLAAHEDGGKRWLLETILQPSREMAPQYTPWQIVTTDGKILTGLPRRKGGSQEAYLGLDGKEFTVKKDQIETHREVNKSVMPDDLLKSLTPQEIADLLAYLMQPK